MLKNGGGVAKVKEHACGFEESFVGNESGLPLMAIFDADCYTSNEHWI